MQASTCSSLTLTAGVELFKDGVATCDELLCNSFSVLARPLTDFGGLTTVEALELRVEVEAAESFKY